jgi:hypothetical protein
MNDTQGSQPHALSVPGVSMSDCANAVDAFCVAKLNYGDRVTFERLQTGAAVSWVFRLDGVELGRFVVTPNKDGFSWRERYTANSRGGEENRPRAALFFDIMDDLDSHFHEYLWGTEPPRMRPARPKFWSKTEAESAAGLNIERNAKIRELIYKNLSDKQIGNKIALGESRVKQIRLEELGLKRRKGRKK